MLASLALLTFVTGIVDTVSVLGLWHVFTANMTRNVVFLGFRFAGLGTVSLAASGRAVGGFLVGAAAGGRLTRTHARFHVVLALEAALLISATFVEMRLGQEGGVRAILITLLGTDAALKRVLEWGVLIAGLGLRARHGRGGARRLHRVDLI